MNPMIGATLSHYAIISKLGQGEMGELYLGEDTKVNIAVLPLVNTSNGSNTEYLSDGISEALINKQVEL